MSVRRLSAALAGALTTLAVTAAASVAATTTIGLGDVSASSGTIAGDRLTINFDFPAGVAPGAPADGRIVRWRINATGSATWRLYVVHPTGASNEYVATAADEQTSTTDGVNTFTPATPLRVAAGDQIAVIRLAGTASVRTRTGLVHRYVTGPAPAVGTTVTFATGAGRVLLFNADVEPDELGRVLRPIVSGLAFGRGPTTGGETLTIAGENFTDGSEVLFGDVPARSVTVERYDRIRAVVPPHAPGTVPIRVITPLGISPVLAAGAYVYVG